MARLEYAYDGEGSSQWPKDVLPAEKTEGARLELLDRLKKRILEGDPDSEEMFKLVFKVASYDLRDGLHLAQAVGMKAWNKRLLLLAQLPVEQPLIRQLYAIASRTVPLQGFASEVEKRRGQGEDVDLLHEEQEDLAKLHQERGVARTLREDDLRSYLHGKGGRQWFDKMNVLPEDQSLMDGIFRVYNSIALQNKHLRREKDRSHEQELSSDRLTKEEREAVLFADEVFDEHVYDRYVAGKELAEAIRTGELMPEIAAQLKMPEKELREWSPDELQDVMQQCWKLREGYPSFRDPRAELAAHLARCLRQYAKGNGEIYDEDERLSLLASPTTAEYKEISDWFQAHAFRPRPLSELRRRARQQVFDLTRVQRQLRAKAEELGRKNLKNFVFLSRAQALDKVIAEFSVLVSGEADEFVEQDHAMIAGVSFRLVKEDPFHTLPRRADLVSDGVDGGGHRPLLLGIGIPARASTVTEGEAVQFFADLFPETVAAIGGRDVLYTKQKERKGDYLRQTYAESMSVFEPRDESLNYDGDPKDERGELAEFPEPFTGVLIQGLYQDYSDEGKRWTGIDSLSDAVAPEEGEEVRDRVVGLHVNNFSGSKKIRLPVTMNGTILADRIIGQKYQNVVPGGHYSVVKQFPLKAERLASGQLEVTLPPYPPSIGEVYYTIREPVTPRLPKQATQQEYDAWLKENKMVGDDFLDKRKEAWETLPPECQAFVKSIKPLPPLERVVRIQEYVHQIGFYDMENGELAMVKNNLTREERFEFMRVRMDELRARQGIASTEKHYAGVCADFEELSAALLTASGIKAGKATGISVHNNDRAKPRDLHAFSYVPFPDKAGKRMVLEVDATPAATQEGQENFLEGIRQRSLRDQFAEEGILLSQEGDFADAEETEKERVASISSPDAAGRIGRAANGELSADVVRVQKQLTPAELAMVTEVIQPLSAQERRQLSALRDVMLYSPLKNMLVDAHGVEKKLLLLQTLLPALETASSSKEDDPEKESATLMLKWRTLLEDWSKLLTPAVSKEAFRSCADALRVKMSPEVYEAFLRITHIGSVIDVLPPLSESGVTVGKRKIRRLGEVPAQPTSAI